MRMMFQCMWISCLRCFFLSQDTAKLLLLRFSRSQMQLTFLPFKYSRYQRAGAFAGFPNIGYPVSAP